MSAIDHVEIDSRERATSTDVNRVQTLTAHDVQDALMWLVRNNALSTAVPTGVTDGVLGGLKVMPYTPSPSPSVRVFPGMILQYDATDAVTPLGESSPYRLGRHDSGDTGEFLPLLPPEAVQHRWSLIEVRHQQLPVEEQSRDVWDPTLNMFKPQTITKRYRPAVEIRASPGVPGAPMVVTPAAGWIAIAACCVYSVASGIVVVQVVDLRSLLGCRVIGGAVDSGAGYNAIVAGEILLSDNTTSTPGGGWGYLDPQGATTIDTFKGFVIVPISGATTGYEVVNATTGAPLARIYAESHVGGGVRLYDAAGTQWCIVESKVLALSDATFTMSAGANEKLQATAAGELTLGGTRAATARTYIDGPNGTMYSSTNALLHGFLFRSGAGADKTIIGGWMTTYPPDCVGYVLKMYQKSGSPVGAYDPVEFVFDGVSEIRARPKPLTAIIICNDAGGGTDLYSSGRVDGIALNTPTSDTDPLYVCVYGMCVAWVTNNAANPGERVCMSNAANNQLMTTTWVLNLNECGRIMTPQISPPDRRTRTRSSSFRRPEESSPWVGVSHLGAPGRGAGARRARSTSSRRRR